MCEAAEGERADQPGRGLGHHDVDERALLGQLGGEVGCLVAGDAPGDPQDDVLSFENVRHLWSLPFRR